MARHQPSNRRHSIAQFAGTHQLKVGRFEPEFSAGRSRAGEILGRKNARASSAVTHGPATVMLGMAVTPYKSASPVLDGPDLHRKGWTTPECRPSPICSPARPLSFSRSPPSPARTFLIPEAHSPAPDRTAPPALPVRFGRTLEKLKKPLGSALEQGMESVRSRDVRDLGS